MCEQCCADTETIGDVLPGISLVRARKQGSKMKPGDWGLVEGNDPFFIWSGEIVPDPFENLTDDEINACTDEQEAEFDRWGDAYEPFRFMECDPRIGYEMISEAIELGYDPKEGSVNYWLWCRMAKLVRGEPVSNVVEIKLDPRHAWMEAHPEELRKCKGMWIAVHPELGIISAAKTLKEVDAEVTKSGVDRDTLLFTTR